MSKKVYLIFILCLAVLFTGCSKKEPAISTEETAETEHTESTTEDEFAINNANKTIPGYEVRETRKSKEEQQEERESIIEQVQREYQESNQEILESAASEEAEREVIESGYSVDVTELEGY